MEPLSSGEHRRHMTRTSPKDGGRQPMPDFAIRNARSGDVDGLMQLEVASFEADRVSRASFRRLIGRVSAAVRIVSSGGRVEPRMGNRSALQPGSMISVALMSGDLNIAADGTLTYIDQDKIYAFGHRFLAIGPTDLPFAPAPNRINAFSSLRFRANT